MVDPFEGHFAKQVIPRKALTIISTVSMALDEEPEIVVFSTDMPGLGPWICFNIGDRKFGIWTANLKLYEADEDGAMGDDPLDPSRIA